MDDHTGGKRKEERKESSGRMPGCYLQNRFKQYSAIWKSYASLQGYHESIGKITTECYRRQKGHRPLDIVTSGSTPDDLNRRRRTDSPQAFRSATRSLVPPRHRSPAMAASIEKGCSDKVFS